MNLENYDFYKFRYTLGVDEPLRRALHLQTIFGFAEMEEYYAVGGYEELNKLGEKTHPHIHIHFAIHQKYGKSIGGMRKALQREFKARGETRKGNVLYSLVMEEDVKDLNRFLRYPLKQLRRLNDGFMEKLPDDFDIKIEARLAKEEQERMWEFNRKKQAESLKPNTKDKLFEYLDSINDTTQFISEKSILIKICEYYNQEEKSANKSTILGYLQTAMWRYKLETFEATADKWLK